MGWSWLILWRELIMCSSSQVLLQLFQIGRLKLDHGKNICTMETGKYSIQISFPQHPNQSQLTFTSTPLVPSSLIFSDFTGLVDTIPWNPWSQCWLTDLGSVGVQHFHVLQLLQTLTVAQDGRFIVASDKCFIPLFFQGYENKSHTGELSQHTGILLDSFPWFSNSTLKGIVSINLKRTCHLFLFAGISGSASLRILFSEFTPSLLSSFSEKVTVSASRLRNTPHLPTRPSLHTQCFIKSWTTHFLTNMASFRSAVYIPLLV